MTQTKQTRVVSTDLKPLTGQTPSHQQFKMARSDRIFKTSLPLQRHNTTHSHTFLQAKIDTSMYQGITFEKVRRATNRSLKMTIWSLGSDLCYEEKNIRQGRHYNTIRQGAPFHHCLSGRRHFNTTTRSL